MEHHPPEIVIPLLERMREENSGTLTFPQAYSHLEPGDSMLKIQSTAPHYLLIDSHPIIATIADKPRPARAIQELFTHRTDDRPYRARHNFYQEHAQQHIGQQIVRLSDLIEAKRGDCLEFSAVAQLVAQIKGSKFHTLSAYAATDNDFVNPHTFNISEKESGLYLVDIANDAVSRITGVLQREDETLQLETEKETTLNYFLN